MVMMKGEWGRCECGREMTGFQTLWCPVCDVKDEVVCTGGMREVWFVINRKYSASWLMRFMSYDASHFTGGMSSNSFDSKEKALLYSSAHSDKEFLIIFHLLVADEQVIERVGEEKLEVFLLSAKILDMIDGASI